MVHGGERSTSVTHSPSEFPRFAPYHNIKSRLVPDRPGEPAHQDLDDAIEGAFKGERHLAGGPKQARVDEQKGRSPCGPRPATIPERVWVLLLVPLPKATGKTHQAAAEEKHGTGFRYRVA